MASMAVTIAHEVLLRRKRKAMKKLNKTVPKRTNYLWANNIIYVEDDGKTPIIEG